jgi:hypothetical protein
MFNKLIVIITVALVFQSCSSSKSNNKLHLLDISQDTITKIDAKGIFSISNYYQPYQSENVYYLDETNRNLFVLNTSQLRFKKICMISSIPSDTYIEGFSVNENNQKIHAFYDNAIHSFNFKGDSIGTQSFEKAYKNGFLTQLNRSYPVIEQKGLFYALFFPNIEETFQSSRFYQQPIEAEYNTKTNMVRLINQNYPTNYKQNCYGINYTPDRILISDKIHGFSFPYNDSLFTINIATGKKESAFYGSRRKHHFEYIPYAKLEGLNQAIFNELNRKNSSYVFSFSAPLAGYYGRCFFLKNSANKYPKYPNYPYLILVNNKLEYIGESRKPIHGIPVDSKNGLYTVLLNSKSHHLIISKLSW